ncbi:MAG: hypothetical protein KF910_02720 [Brevundimonas sp.]|uniref:hypothetical protein n=1 Tax=Brevundimonas sp. TaxID=1871086 RepID=UPI0025B9AA0B|nr:hypothetical protein [Brevundimonas sp.]MBX3476499.1 hypothetical protein [Brevundimonas sp.]
MFIPKWLLAVVLVLVASILGWSVMVAMGRNPLPFPDPGSRIFTASSVEGKDAVVALLERYGGKERLRADSAQVRRSIMMDGTIINHSTPAVMGLVGGADACIGLVASDPAAAAADAAEFLQSKGFRAEVVQDVEPGMPITFVLTDALTGSCINFRRDILHMMRSQK